MASTPNAILTIFSQQFADNDSDQSTLKSPAIFSFQNGLAEIRYADKDETGKHIGETTIQMLSHNRLTIRKTGFTESMMILELNHTHACHYRTMVGEMDMQVTASHIEADFQKTGGILALRYLLRIGEQYTAENVINLHIRLLPHNECDAIS